MYQLANTYTFVFGDGEKIRIGPDPSVDNWAGHVTDISLSSDAALGVTSIPGVHGAVVGQTSLGALAITMEVLITGPDAAERAMRLRLLDRLSRAYTEDLEIRWTEGDGIERRLAGVRKSQFAPIGHTDGPAKKRVLSFVCPAPYIETRRRHSLQSEVFDGAAYGPESYGGEGITMTAVNAGTATAWPEFRITSVGSDSAFKLTNVTTGKHLIIDSPGVSGDVLIKTKPHERGVWSGSTNIYHSLDWLTSEFFGFEPGENLLRFDSKGYDISLLNVEWRSAWLF